jgi:hypothetical protein
MTGSFGFRYLLGGIMLAYVLAIAVPIQSIGSPLRIAVLGGLLAAAVRTRRRAGRLALPVRVLVVVLFVATLLAGLFGSDTALTVTAQVATILLTVAAITVLVHTLVGLGVVDGSAVNGVLCIYLLLALFFGSLHLLFAAIIPHYVHGAATPVRISDMLYFSVITLTTVGFGDITPACGLARAITSVEALIGQLYLVSVVAAVVARYRRPGHSSAGSTDE